jgi:hypothetical protein
MKSMVVRVEDGASEVVKMVKIKAKFFWGMQTLIVPDDDPDLGGTGQETCHAFVFDNKYTEEKRLKDLTAVDDANLLENSPISQVWNYGKVKDMGGGDYEVVNEGHNFVMFSEGHKVDDILVLVLVSSLVDRNRGVIVYYS